MDDDRINWTICPVCEGDEGHATPGELEWVDCDFCEGSGGWAELTPADRDRILAEAAPTRP